MDVALIASRSFWCAYPFAIDQIPPASVHIQPLADRLMLSRFRTHAQDISIQVLDLHFVGPLVVGWGMAHLGTAGTKLFEERFVHTDPDPGSRIALVSLTQKNVATISRNGCDDRRLPVNLESETADVIFEACGEALHAKDWSDALEATGS